MTLSRTTVPARPGARVLLCLIDVAIAGVILVAVLSIFAVMSILVPGAGSPFELLGKGCNLYQCEPDLESTADIPTWYEALFVVVTLAAIALCSGALDAQRRTPGMRILSLYAMKGDAGLSTAEVVPPVPARWVMAVRWWIVVAVFVAGTLVGQLLGGLIVVVLAWGVVLLPGRRTLWDRLTGVRVVELTFGRGAERT